MTRTVFSSPLPLQERARQINAFSVASHQYLVGGRKVRRTFVTLLKHVVQVEGAWDLRIPTLDDDDGQGEEFRVFEKGVGPFLCICRGRGVETKRLGAGVRGKKHWMSEMIWSLY